MKRSPDRVFPFTIFFFRRCPLSPLSRSKNAVIIERLRNHRGRAGLAVIGRRGRRLAVREGQAAPRGDDGAPGAEEEGAKGKKRLVFGHGFFFSFFDLPPLPLSLTLSLSQPQNPTQQNVELAVAALFLARLAFECGRRYLERRKKRRRGGAAPAA